MLLRANRHWLRHEGLVHLQAIARGACFLAAALIAVSADGAPLRVRITGASPDVRGPLGIVITASGSTERIGSLEMMSGEVTTRDVAPGIYSAVVAGDAFWAAPQTVSVSENGATVTLVAFRRAKLNGRFRLPKGESRVPGQLMVRFRTVGESIPSAEGEAPCVVNGLQWSCPVPATALDASFKATGYLAVFRRELDAKFDRDVGTYALRRGASLVGRIAVPAARRPETTKAVVTLEPEMAAASRDDRGKILIYTAGADRRGNFHFDGIAPGRYLVSASLARLSARTQPVVIKANTEAQLRNPLVLDEPQSIEIAVTPPRDPRGRPWSVELRRQTEIHGVVVTERQARLDDTDRWEVRDLPPGDYTAMLRDSIGDVWLTREFSLPNDASTVELDGSAAVVRGDLFLGGKPLRALLWIGGEGHVPAIRALSNERGRFSVRLPQAQASRIELVTVRADEPKVHAHVRPTLGKLGENDFHMKIELPSTRIDGVVVDADGKPVSRAVVNVSPAEGSLLQLPVAADGTFRVEGISEGVAELAALAGGKRQSDRKSIDVRSGSPPELVQLVVRSSRVLQGHVVSSAGAVPGAIVHAFPVPAGAFISPRLATDADGRFAHELPPGCNSADLFVIAPGFALRVFRQAITDDMVAVPVSQVSSALRIKLPREVVERNEWPKLVHGGAAESLVLFLAFGAQLQKPDGDLWVVEIPDIEPGGYSLCSSADRCVSATAPPFGIAELTLPTH